MVKISSSERNAVAKQLRLHEQYVYQVLTGRRPMPVERCALFERALQGRVQCEQLRPDIAWHRLSDADWPWHPEGRPLIDVTRTPAGVMAAAHSIARGQHAG